MLYKKRSRPSTFLAFVLRVVCYAQDRFNHSFKNGSLNQIDWMSPWLYLKKGLEKVFLTRVFWVLRIFLPPSLPPSPPLSRTNMNCGPPLFLQDFSSHHGMQSNCHLISDQSVNPIRILYRCLMSPPIWRNTTRILDEISRRSYSKVATTTFVVRWWVMVANIVVVVVEGEWLSQRQSVMDSCQEVLR